MKEFRPESWSQQARRMANNRFNYYVQGCECGDPENEWLIQCASIEHHRQFFSNSYRPYIVTTRAAKRFGRLRRKYEKTVAVKPIEARVRYF